MRLWIFQAGCRNGDGSSSEWSKRVVVREWSEMKTCNRLWTEVTRQIVMHDEGASCMSYVQLQRYQHTSDIVTTVSHVQAKLR